MNPNLLMHDGSPTGAMAVGDFQALQKSLEAGYGTDVAGLTGGAALRIQSLDATMQSTIQENAHFRLMNRLPKSKASATVDEWTEQNGIGGFLGGNTNTESGAVGDSTGDYARRVGMVRYLTTLRQVSFVQSLQNAIADAEAVEYTNGTLELLSTGEYLSFEGDSAVVTTEIDGIYAQMMAGVAAGQVDGHNILDARGSTLSSVNLVNQASATIAGFGNFGTPTDIFLSQLVQADFDTGLDPAYRVSLSDVGNGGLSLGAPVVGIRTSWGNIKTNPDVFIRDEMLQTPFELRYPAVAAAQTGLVPTLGAPDASVTDAASLFGAGQAGNYYYAVSGTNAKGQSAVVKSSQVAVAAGKKVTVVITASAGGEETGYTIYRSRKDGTNATSDFREVCRIAKAGATTTYTDRNIDIPGTSKAFVLNLAPGATAITWRQLLPMIKFPLYPTNSAVIPWLQMMFGYLRISKRRHHVVIKNILPNGALWRPFG
ncbi:MAG: hypothetical protein GC191_09175 [Azospirillum sp.]|nr:hypothetical protein [Azospirillum sp.]